MYQKKKKFIPSWKATTGIHVVFLPHIVSRQREALQHGRDVLEHSQLQRRVAYPPDDGAGLVRLQSVSEQHPGQENRSVVGDVAKSEQQLVNFLEKNEEDFCSKN